MSLPQPAKTRLRSFIINNVQIRELIKSLSVYETVCKPYLTATVVIRDKENLINNMRLIGGEEVTFSFDGNERRIYSAKLYILSISKAQFQPNLRYLEYTVQLIGKAYFNDRVNLIQQSFKGLTGTDAIKILHDSYVGGDAPLSVLAGSFGLLARDNPYIVQSAKPFKAIDDVRRTLNFANYKTGNSLYYRDRDQYVLAPLELLFERVSNVQASFVQRATWGYDIHDYVRAYFSVMKAELDVHGTQSAIGELASVANQGKTVFDLNLMRTVQTVLQQQVSPGKVVGTALVNLVGDILKGKTNGGEPNFQVMDTYNRSVETDTSSKTERERLYATTAKSGPRVNVQVPIQGGAECTVGKGINLQLQPPVGDIDSNTRNLYKGNWLVIDLTHNLTFESDKLYQGTTTMKCIRGGVG
jgi:hypothetical protein